MHLVVPWRFVASSPPPVSLTKRARNTKTTGTNSATRGREGKRNPPCRTDFSRHERDRRDDTRARESTPSCKVTTTTATTATADRVRYESQTTSRQIRGHTHIYTHTRARARVEVAASLVRTYVRVGEEPVLEVRKRTTTTHHRLATALLPLTAFPYKLRAAAVSLYPSAPLTLARLPHEGLPRTTVRSRHVVRRSCN